MKCYNQSKQNDKLNEQMKEKLKSYVTRISVTEAAWYFIFVHEKECVCWLFMKSSERWDERLTLKFAFN